MAARKNTRLYLVALALFLLGTGALLYSGIATGSSSHLEVRDVLSMPVEKLSSVHLTGSVRGNSITKLEGSPGVVFLLQDNTNPGQAVKVVYNGAVPAAFKDGAAVIIQGRCSSADKTITAHSLTTQCPSKYKAQQRT